MNIAILIDIFIVVLFVIFTVVSAKKGFIVSLMQLLSSILAVLLAIKISEILVPYVYQLFEEKIVESIAATISNFGDSKSTSAQAEIVIGKFPKIFLGFAEFFNIDLIKYSKYLYPTEFTVNGVSQEIADKIIYPVALKIINIVLSVILFIVLFIVLRLISRAISKLFNKLPIINVVNKLLGAVLGIAKYVVFIAIFSAIIYIVLNVVPFNSDRIPAIIFDSKILSFCYQYNPLILILTGK